MMVRRVLVVAAILAATTGLAPTSGPAPGVAPAAAGDCADGVIVVVDASAFGAGLSERCVPGAPGDGLEALTAAEHTYTDHPRHPGLVCTIDERPDPCNGAPTDAYWSYWHADQGGAWRYSNQGAGSRNPQPGTVEGWSFGAGSPPGTAPPGGEPEPEPEPEPEAPEDEDAAEEPPAGSGGSGGSDGSGGSGSGGSDGSGSPGSEGTGSGSSGGGGSTSTEAGSSGSGTTSDTHGDDASSDETAGAAATEQTIEPAEPAGEVPVDGTADAEPGDREDDAPTEEEADTARPEDDTVALPDRDDDRLPVGLVAGGGLLAGLAGLTAFQVRRRRLEG